MKLQPLSNHVLVEPFEGGEKEQKTKSGIVLPDTAEKKKQSKGTVVAIGPGKLEKGGERLLLSVKTGDTVLFKEPWSEENKIEDGDKKYFLIDEDDILAIIE